MVVNLTVMIAFGFVLPCAVMRGRGQVLKARAAKRRAALVNAKKRVRTAASAAPSRASSCSATLSSLASTEPANEKKGGGGGGGGICRSSTVLTQEASVKGELADDVNGGGKKRGEEKGEAKGGDSEGEDSDDDVRGVVEIIETAELGWCSQDCYGQTAILGEPQTFLYDADATHVTALMSRKVGGTPSSSFLRSGIYTEAPDEIKGGARYPVALRIEQVGDAGRWTEDALSSDDPVAAARKRILDSLRDLADTDATELAEWLSEPAQDACFGRWLFSVYT